MQKMIRLSDRWLGGAVAIALLVIMGTTLYVRQRDNAKVNITISNSSWQPDDLRVAVEESQLIIEGVVKEIQPARWTTPNNIAPIDPSEITNNLDVQLRTPVVLSVEHTFKGKPTGDTILFTVPGGVSEQYRVLVEDSLPLTPGTRVIVFLGAATADAGPWAQISPFYPQIYFVVEGDNLRGPIKQVSRDSVLKQLYQEGN